jgi:SAM-dependent methyltransferase
MDARDWNARYAETALVWSAGPNRSLVSETAGLPAGRALDLACGEGRNAIWLGEQGWRVTGVDFSDVAIEKARLRAPELDWRVADLLAFEPEPEGYDLVILFYLQLVAEELRTVLARAAGAVAPGGTLLLVAHDARNLTEGHGGPKDASVLYRPEDVVAAVGAGFEVERAESVRRTVEGAPRDAIDALVRLRRARVPARPG